MPLAPHHRCRLASLSEGRIDPKDGSLQCAYHGWGFDGQGNCTAIPQITDPTTHAAACRNKKTAAQAHPTQVLSYDVAEQWRGYRVLVCIPVSNCHT